MAEEQWAAVDRYFCDLFVPQDAALEQALADSAAAGLPAISVSAMQGKLLMLLAMSCGAKRILEIGTLGGYSTIWLGRALPPPPEGRLITLEAAPRHAEVARANVARAGLAELVDVRLGRAIDTLPKLADEGAGPFDLVFIDADKQSTPDYFEWALKLTRRGSLIVVDNVVRGGAIADKSRDDEGLRGLRRFNELAAAEPRVSVTAIQTVGSKGYDGFALAVVTGD